MSGKPCAHATGTVPKRWSSPHSGDSAHLVVAHDNGRFLARRSLAGDWDVLKSQREQVQANEIRQRSLLQPAPGGPRARVRRDATGAGAMPGRCRAQRARDAARGAHSLRQLNGGNGMSAWAWRGGA